MKALDNLLQEWRYRVVSPHIPAGARILDVGSYDGSLFRRFRDRSVRGVGIDMDVMRSIDLPLGVELMEGKFPDSLPGGDSFDVVTALAVIEHVPDGGLTEWVDACADQLNIRGWLIITVPSPLVDRILGVLLFLRLADGMALEGHHGFDPRQVPMIFGRRFSLVKHRRFQLGLNHLFVFRKT